MPRKARLFVPGCLHHIMARGLDGFEIFMDDSDRNVFIDLFANALEKSGYRCYAWALLSNHYHLVVRSSDRPLSELMKPLNSRYATWFNKRTSRRGYLFQDRFKSIASQDQNYIESMIRYVHLNPVRAGICRNLRELDKYRWSGHSALMGRNAAPFQDTATVLQRFSTDLVEGRRLYREFISNGLELSDDMPTEQIRSCTQGGQSSTKPQRWVIGDPSFVKSAIDSAAGRQLRIAHYAAMGLDLQKIADAVVSEFEIDSKDLFCRVRSGVVSDAKKAFCYLAHRRFEIPVIEIARFLRTGGSSVSRMVSAGEKIAETRNLMDGNF